MNDSEPFIARLRQLIGRDCRYYGRSCRIVEILSAEGQVVLEAKEAMPPIQVDQYGQAAFRGNEHIEVPMFNHESELSDDLQHLLDGLSAARTAR